MDDSIISTEEIDYMDEPIENQASDSERISDTADNMDENSSCKSTESVHGDSDSVECNICSKLYKRKAHLLRHLMSHKGDDSGRSNYRKRHHVFVCNKCGKRFSKSKALQNHENEGACVESEVSRTNFIFTLRRTVSNDLIFRIHNAVSARSHFQMYPLLKSIWLVYIPSTDHICVRYAKKRFRVSRIGILICNHITKVIDDSPTCTLQFSLKFARQNANFLRRHLQMHRLWARI